MLAIVPVVLTLVVLVAIIFNVNSKLIESESNSAYQLLIDAEQEKLKNIIDAAYHIVKPIYESGGSKEQGVELLSRIAFGEDGYIFGYDGDSVRIFSGTSDASIGKSYKTFKDVNDVYLINDLITAGKNNNLGLGNNFVTYHFPKLGGETPHPKLSYSIFLEKWDLMIGTGVYIDQIDSSIAAFEDHVVEAQDGTYMSIALVGILVVCAVLILGTIIIRSILVPLNSVSNSIAKLSVGNGDLTQRVPVQDKFETGKLAENLNNLLISLQQDMKHVFSIANEIKSQTDSLVTQADNITEVSEGQGLTIEKVMHASDELSAMTNKVETFSVDASNATKTVHERGQFALKQVQTSTSQMLELNNEMNSASDVVKNVGVDVENIGTILQVIESIAEQTNLLALNAAIEAARAGEQGRGFAVVADEVRNLASKTQGSTEEIKQMINKLQSGSKSAVDAMERSMSRSSAADKSVSETANSLSDIATSVEVIHNNNALIVEASERQKLAKGDIEQTVMEITEQIQRLHTISSQNNGVSEKLGKSADQLHKIVGQFTL